jgi:hypothetical protein
MDRMNKFVQSLENQLKEYRSKEKEDKKYQEEIMFNQGKTRNFNIIQSQLKDYNTHNI